MLMGDLRYAKVRLLEKAGDGSMVLRTLKAPGWSGSTWTIRSLMVMGMPVFGKESGTVVRHRGPIRKVCGL